MRPNLFKTLKILIKILKSALNQTGSQNRRRVHVLEGSFKYTLCSLAGMISCIAPLTDGVGSVCCCSCFSHCPLFHEGAGGCSLQFVQHSFLHRPDKQPFVPFTLTVEGSSIGKKVKTCKEDTII